ncbi:MAG: hypothetical protein GVY29_07385 [Spirochaetes bacterium]|jgi:hypothetical protein|nr:hypothetical protein [Spirochaetota bacterium]
MKVTVELEIDINLLDVKIEDVKRLVKEMVSAEESDAVKSVTIKNVRLG